MIGDKYVVSEKLTLKHVTAQKAQKNGRKTKFENTPTSLNLTFLMKVTNYHHGGRGPQWPQIAINLLVQNAYNSFAYF